MKSEIKPTATNGRDSAGSSNLSTTVPKGTKAMIKRIKGGLFLLALSAASSLQQLSYAQIAEAPASSIFTVVRTPNIRPFPFHADLAAVSASSGSDIWAVGQSGVHFDGLTWTAFALPHIAGDLTSGITGVADLAPNNVWSVGNINIGEQNPNQIIEHFDGTRWGVSPGPSFQPTDQPHLEGLTAISATNMWAAGAILTTINGMQFLFPLFEHFDGTSWTATIDESTLDGFLFGISADATNDVWAFGDTDDFGPSKIKNLVLHWNGTTWSIVPSPAPNPRHTLIDDVIAGGTVIPQGNLWLVGVADGFGTMVLNATGQ